MELCGRTENNRIVNFEGQPSMIVSLGYRNHRSASKLT